jgi:hypothetical protein
MAVAPIHTTLPGVTGVQACAAPSGFGLLLALPFLVSLEGLQVHPPGAGHEQFGDPGAALKISSQFTAIGYIKIHSTEVCDVGVDAAAVQRWPPSRAISLTW